MGGVRELRGRIKSVGNIRQITRAMEMVASTKLRRFQDKAISSRPYSQEISGLVGRLAQVMGDELEGRPLFKAGVGKAVAVLLVVLGLVLRNQADFAKSYVHDQMVEQRISFTPAAGLSADEKTASCLVDNAGKPLLTGKQAECYAKRVHRSSREANQRGKDVL